MQNREFNYKVCGKLYTIIHKDINSNLLVFNSIKTYQQSKLKTKQKLKHSSKAKTSFIQYKHMNKVSNKTNKRFINLSTGTTITITR